MKDLKDVLDKFVSACVLCGREGAENDVAVALQDRPYKAVGEAKICSSCLEGLAEPSTMRLREIIRMALKECTSGDYVDRALRAQAVLEDGLSDE